MNRYIEFVSEVEGQRGFGSQGFRDVRRFSGERGRTEGKNFGGREHHGRHGGRGGRGRRPFDNGELRWVILSLIAEQPRHGYEIIKAIEDQFGGSYAPSPGVVYPTLTMLEELGNATVEESGGKRQYSITEQGRGELAGNRSAVDAALSRMAQAAGSQGRRGAAPQLIRAMENLKLSLRLRQRDGSLSEPELRKIVEAIDAAALAIERV